MTIKEATYWRMRNEPRIPLAQLRVSLNTGENIYGFTSHCLYNTNNNEAKSSTQVLIRQA